MTDSEPKAPAKRKPSASKAEPKAATSKSAASAGGSSAGPKPRATAPKAAPPPAESRAPVPLLPDEAPIPPRNRHERRSAGKKRPGQAPFKWPPIGPERP